MKKSRVIIFSTIGILLLGVIFASLIYLQALNFIKIENKSTNFSLRLGDSTQRHEFIDSLLLSKREYYLPGQKSGSKIKSIIINTVDTDQWFSIENSPNENLSLVSSSSKIENGNLIVNLRIKPEGFKDLSGPQLKHRVYYNIWYQIYLAGFSHDYSTLDARIFDKGISILEKTKSDTFVIEEQK